MFDHRAADRIVLLLNTLLLMVVAFPSVRDLRPCRGFAQRTRPANRRPLLGHRIRRNGAHVQRRLAVRSPSRPAQRSPRPSGRDSHQQALSTRPCLARDRRPARRRTTRPGRGRDRRLQRLLLAPDPRREPPPTSLMRAHCSQSPCASVLHLTPAPRGSPRDGAFIEPSGRNRRQPAANAAVAKTPQSGGSASAGTARNRPGAHGKEGVDGSSP
jgi:hypothetical protein